LIQKLYNVADLAVLRIRIRDPAPFLPLDMGSGMGKKSGSGSGSWMNNQDHISESLETIFWGLSNFFMWILDGKKFGSGINIPDPQHGRNNCDF
jgi:hypothetical protein